MAEVLVLVELNPTGEGVRKTTLEALTAARVLGEVSAVVIGAPGTAGVPRTSPPNQYAPSSASRTGPISPRTGPSTSASSRRWPAPPGCPWSTR